MKLRRGLLPLTLLLLTLTSCHKSKNDFSGSGTSSFSLQQESEESYPLSDGAQVGIYLLDNKSVLQDNLWAVHDGKGGLHAKLDVNYNSLQNIEAYSIAPYNLDWTYSADAEYDFSVYANQTLQADYIASDLMLGVPSAGYPLKSSNIEFNFSHLYSRITIEILDTENSGLGESTVTLLGLYNSAKVNPFAGEVKSESLDGKGDITPYEYVHTIRRIYAYAVVPPQEIAAGEALLKVVYKDKEMYCGLPQTQTLGCGETLALTLNMTSSGIEVVSSSMEDWVAGEDVEIEI